MAGNFAWTDIADSSNCVGASWNAPGILGNSCARSLKGRDSLVSDNDRASFPGIGNK